MNSISMKKKKKRNAEKMQQNVRNDALQLHGTVEMTVIGSDN